MNREIKFRGLDFEGRWHYGLPCIIKSGEDKGSYISNIAGIPMAYQIKPETLSQFTGLTDKVGDDVYEGDIVEREIYVQNEFIKIYFEIIFKSGCFGFFSKEYNHANLIASFSTVKIVGHIFQPSRFLNEENQNA